LAGVSLYLCATQDYSAAMQRAILPRAYQNDMADRGRMLCHSIAHVRWLPAHAAYWSVHESARLRESQRRHGCPRPIEYFEWGCAAQV